MEKPRIPERRELNFCWRGLVITITDGYLPHEQVIHALHDIDIEQGREEAEVLVEDEPTSP